MKCFGFSTETSWIFLWCCWNSGWNFVGFIIIWRIIAWVTHVTNTCVHDMSTQRKKSSRPVGSKDTSKSHLYSNMSVVNQVRCIDERYYCEGCSDWWVINAGWGDMVRMVFTNYTIMYKYKYTGNHFSSHFAWSHTFPGSNNLYHTPVHR